MYVLNPPSQVGQLRAGKSADEAAAVAAALAKDSAATRAAMARGTADGANAMPDVAFWRRTAVDPERAEAELFERWRPLGPPERKRIKARIMYALDR